MKYQVYQITNKINGKVYIGKHQCSCKECQYFGSGKLLKRAIKKHGLTNFTKTILFEYDNEQDMIDKEKELVTEQFCSLDTNYNLCEGGKGGFGYINREELTNRRLGGLRASNNLIPVQKGQNHSRKIKQNISHSLIKYFENNKHQWVGRKHTPETIKKMCDSHKGAQIGKRNSQYGTMWITNGVINKKIKKDLPIPMGFNKGRI